MDRDIEHELKKWKRSKRRMPLILRGARQVGKSYIVEKFGQEHFDHTVVVNFELEPNFTTCFSRLDPMKIIRELEVIAGQPITQGKTLLFLDEIQVCPRAITALRYFKEKLPGLHVLGAGSLLEFVIEDEQFSFPVGRVQFLHMHPLSFREFLMAMGEERLVRYLSDIGAVRPISSAIHEHAMELVKQYLLIGGMPEVVQAFSDGASYGDCGQLQTGLLQTYANDFGKYATKVRHKYLRMFLEKAPLLVGRHFQYVKVDPNARSRDLKLAMEQLCHAGLIRRIYATKGGGIPLRAEVNEKKFRLLFLDSGLMQRALGIDPMIVLREDVLAVHSGQLAEQFVGQELIAYRSGYDEPHLYFWERAKVDSSAEVDFVIAVDSKVVPIEVKAGKTGRLRSLQQFMTRKKAPLGVRISERPLSLEKGVLSLPFYLIEQLPRLVESIS